MSQYLIARISATAEHRRALPHEVVGGRAATDIWSR